MCQNTGLATAQARSEPRLGMSMAPSTLVKQGVIAVVARSTAVIRALFIFVLLSLELGAASLFASGSKLRQPRRGRPSNDCPTDALLLFLPQLFAQVFGAVDRFAGPKIFHLKELADFDFGFAAGLQVRLEGNALGPLNGLFLRFHLNDP